MKTLLIFRHGQAESTAGIHGDHGRALTERGRKEAGRQASQWAFQTSDAWIVSDARRTKETADALIHDWALASDQRPVHLHITPQGYLAEADRWMDLIAMAPPQAHRVWAVGHNPGLSDLVFLLTGRGMGLSTADIVEVELSIDTWMDIAPGKGRFVSHHPGRIA